MIPRLKGVIAHSYDTKLLGENGEDTTLGWGTRPSPKTKPFKEDPRDASTCGWGNRPNPKKKLHVHRRGRWSRPGNLYTHLTADED